ncbi:MAG: PLDc N-terminal domain-containing protein [Candidatus Dormibacteraeota bacterium]|nr:PLDc N-terminal domain-containing protein [Candidatus Dormibacteraeota bacterium]
MIFSLLLPNLVLFLLLAGVVPWVFAIIDILRAPDLTGEMRVVWMLVLVFAWPVGIVAWLVLRGRRRWRQVAIVVLAGMMSLTLVVTVFELYLRFSRTM